MYIRKRNKTKSKIRKAYGELLLEKGPLGMTILDICKKSDINRSTFYEYYSSIDMLINDVIHEQVNAISKVNRSLYDKFYIDNMSGPGSVKKYMENIASNEILISLIKSKESRRFKAEIMHAQCEYEIKKYRIYDFEKQLQVIYRNSGVLIIIFRWIEKERGYDINTVADLLYEQIRKTEQQ